MTIDEQELRQRLGDTATQASPPQFTAEGLARQVRRRRARVISAVSGAVATAIAVAVAVPLAVSGSNQQAPVSIAPRIPPEPSVTVTVNGRTTTHWLSSYVISPGEDMAITVDVTFPARLTVTGLWLGIIDGVLAGHADMSPILEARTGTHLLPGVHRFQLHWVVPRGLRPGTSRQLSAEWTWNAGVWPPGEEEGIIDELHVRAGGPGTYLRV